jgi:hypothetical protein
MPFLESLSELASSSDTRWSSASLHSTPSSARSKPGVARLAAAALVSAANCISVPSASPKQLAPWSAIRPLISPGARSAQGEETARRRRRGPPKTRLGRAPTQSARRHDHSRLALRARRPHGDWRCPGCASSPGTSSLRSSGDLRVCARPPRARLPSRTIRSNEHRQHRSLEQRPPLALAQPPPRRPPAEVTP